MICEFSAAICGHEIGQGWGILIGSKRSRRAFQSSLHDCFLSFISFPALTARGYYQMPLWGNNTADLLRFDQYHARRKIL